jgi:alpha-1,6-mannosyltransferase
MYSWLHFSMATVAALVAWYTLYRVPEARTELAEEPLAA